MSISAAAYQSRQTEKQFQAAVEQLAHSLGWLSVHFPSMRGNPAGWPDLILLRNGEVMFAELKRERGGRLGWRQSEWIDLLAQYGFEVHVWRPSDWDQIKAALRGPS